MALYGLVVNIAPFTSTAQASMTSGASAPPSQRSPRSSAPFWSSTESALTSWRRSSPAASQPRPSSRCTTASAQQSTPAPPSDNTSSTQPPTAATLRSSEPRRAWPPDPPRPEPESVPDRSAHPSSPSSTSGPPSLAPHLRRRCQQLLARRRRGHPSPPGAVATKEAADADAAAGGATAAAAPRNPAAEKAGPPLRARHLPGSRPRADPGAPPGLPTPPLTHAQRVRKSLAAWRAIGAPPQVLRWISQGVTVKWNERGPPAPFHHGVSRFSPDEREWLATERDRCLGTGAWERATNFDFVSRAFVVAHNGKRRLVIDLRHLNEHCVKRSCRFESLSRLRKLARRHDFMISVDLTDAYHHIAIRPEDRHYFTFAIETPAGVQYFSTAALNFGWTLSPWVFTTFMKAVVSYLRHPLDSDRRPSGAPLLQRVCSGSTRHAHPPLAGRFCLLLPRRAPRLTELPIYAAGGLRAARRDLQPVRPFGSGDRAAQGPAPAITGAGGPPRLLHRLDERALSPHAKARGQAGSGGSISSVRSGSRPAASSPTGPRLFCGPGSGEHAGAASRSLHAEGPVRLPVRAARLAFMPWRAAVSTGHHQARMVGGAAGLQIHRPSHLAEAGHGDPAHRRIGFGLGSRAQLGCCAPTRAWLLDAGRARVAYHVQGACRGAQGSGALLAPAGRAPGSPARGQPGGSLHPDQHGLTLAPAHARTPSAVVLAGHAGHRAEGGLHPQRSQHLGGPRIPPGIAKGLHARHRPLLRSTSPLGSVHRRRLCVTRHGPAAEVLGGALRGGRGSHRRLRSGLGGRVHLGSSTSWSASRPRAFSRVSSSSRRSLRTDVARGAVVLAAPPAGRRSYRAAGRLSSAHRGRRSGATRDVAAHPVPQPRRAPHSIAHAPPSSVSPVAAYLSDRWAQWSGGATAARLAADARQSSTARSYGRHWAAFAEWCALNSLEPLPATPDMVAAYIGSIADRGTVAARSLQPYLSAINSVHADFGYERPALGHFITTVRRGMARTQAATATRDTRIPLPAPAVEAVLDD